MDDASSAAPTGIAEPARRRRAARAGGTGRATIADVAALAGVSVTAVSKVLNGTGSISAATAQRVRAAAATLNWQPSASAVALRRSRSQTVGMVLNRPPAMRSMSSTTGELIAGIESTLNQHGYSLLLHMYASGSEEATYRGLADARRIDGAILIDSLVGDQRFALLRELRLPAVLVGTPWDDDPISHVPTDPRPGLAEAVAHVAELGHRRVAYLGGPEHRVQANQRRVCIGELFAEHGLETVELAITDYSAQQSATRTRELLSVSDRPTALLYGNDTMAIAGMRAAADLGLRVPTDVTVIGFEDLPMSSWLNPTLSTVRRNVADRGALAAGLLLRLLGRTDVTDTTISEPVFVPRQSSGPAPRT